MAKFPPCHSKTCKKTSFRRKLVADIITTPRDPQRDDARPLEQDLDSDRTWLSYNRVDACEAAP